MSFSQMAEYIEEQKKRGHRTDKRTLSRVLLAFRPYTFQISLTLLAILITTLLGLINPLVIRLIFDDAIGKRDLSLLYLYVGILVLTPMIAGLVGVGQTYLSNLVGQQVMSDFRNKLYLHLQRMSFRFFTSTHLGEIQSRLSNDISSAQSTVTETATGVFSNIAIVLSTLIAMLYLSPFLTVISLGLLPFILWITKKIGDTRRQNQKHVQESMAALTSHLQETLSVSGVLLIKTFGRQQYAQRQFERENMQLTSLSIRQQMIGRWVFMFVGIVMAVTPAVVYLIAGIHIIHNPQNQSITLGGIVAFTTLQVRLLSPMVQLLGIQVQVQGALALFDRIFEYLDLPVELEDKPGAISLPADQVRGEISFKHVSFTYKRDGTDAVKNLFASSSKKAKQQKPSSLHPSEVAENVAPRQTLHNLSFHIQPGQLAALVGPSGAGKTTITYLVPRLFDVDEGTVEIDGYDVRDLTQASLSDLVGTVTQETYLFHASIRENLLYAYPDATEEEMIAATRAAAIHDRILELEDSYETVVGERGYKLSGGEKQRLAIARVLLKNPRILILDEATSSLDTASERLIQEALEPLVKSRTTLAIAHRLSTILAADLILVVDKGEIVEYGTHTSLLERNGLYAKLYREQFKDTFYEDAIFLNTVQGINKSAF